MKKKYGSETRLSSDDEQKKEGTNLVLGGREEGRCKTSGDGASGSFSSPSRARFDPGLVSERVYLLVLLLALTGNLLSADYLPGGRNLFLYLLVPLTAGFACRDLLFLFRKEEAGHPLCRFFYAFFSFLFPSFVLRKESLFGARRASLFRFAALLVWFLAFGSAVHFLSGRRPGIYDISLFFCCWLSLVFFPFHILLRMLRRIRFLRTIKKVSEPGLSERLRFECIRELHFALKTSFFLSLILNLLSAAVYIYTVLDRRVEFALSGKGLIAYFANSNSLGLELGISIFLALSVVLFCRGTLVRAAGLFQIGLSYWLLLASRARTTTFAFLLAASGALLLTWILFGWRRTRSLLPVACGLALAFLLYLPISHVHMRLLSREHLSDPAVRTVEQEEGEAADEAQIKAGTEAREKGLPAWPPFCFKGPLDDDLLMIHHPVLVSMDRVLSSRVQLLREGALLMVSQPLQGYGYLQLSEVAGRVLGSHSRLVLLQVSSTHNIFSDAMARGGIPGLLLLLGLFFSLLTRIACEIRSLVRTCRSCVRERERRRTVSFVYVFILASLFLFLTQCFEVGALSTFNWLSFAFCLLLFFVQMFPFFFGEANRGLGLLKESDSLGWGEE